MGAQRLRFIHRRGWLCACRHHRGSAHLRSDWQQVGGLASTAL
jgi:hypothetical protein